MFLRSVVVAAAGLAFVVPAFAQQLTADEARRLVVGKTFSYTCFEGTRGAGSVRPDGSVSGTIQMQGSGPMRRATLPANTLRVSGDRVCASVAGMPFEPCFNLVRTSANSFRGSVSGFSFAYCDFTRGRGRRGLIRAAAPQRVGEPLALRSGFTQ